ncbi:helix-turn-helix domain-containing protein [Streptomyces sp. Pv4-95]|uniref:helix-turn-helix domain-containing protein n=1 Tax=Streptomyces sp. Pv4-95 TaxID=3049543 RepID=UPI003891D8FD
MLIPLRTPALRSSDNGDAVEKAAESVDAARLFRRRGYSGMSTRDLTAAVGRSSSSLYAVFGSKAGLYERALVARIERAVQDGELVAGADAAALTGLVQSVVHGLSVRANLGTARKDLLTTARLAHELVCRQLTM